VVTVKRPIRWNQPRALRPSGFWELGVKAVVRDGVPIGVQLREPTVAKRLSHANANVTPSIYAHALEAGISAHKKRPAKHMRENVSAEKAQELQVVTKIG
jgi:hypothetical protein